MPPKTKNPFSLFGLDQNPMLDAPPSFAPPPMPTGTAPTSPQAMLAPLFAPQQQQGLDWNAIQNIVRKPDVQGERNRAYMPGTDNAANPFSNGFFAQSAASLSPEARQATQGRSAMTQWALLGGVPGVDPKKLRTIMGQMTPIPGPAATPNMTVSDPMYNQRGGITPQVQRHLIELLYGGSGPARI